MNPRTLSLGVMVLASFATIIALARTTSGWLARLRPDLRVAKRVSDSRLLKAVGHTALVASLTILAVDYILAHRLEVALTSGIVAIAWLLCWLLDLVRNPRS